MKKPINSYTIALWFLAALYAALMIPELFEIFLQPNSLHHKFDADYIRSFLARDFIGICRNTVSGSGQLFAMGVIVELIDRVRWDAMNRRTT